MCQYRACTGPMLPAVTEQIDCLEANQEADTEDLKAHKKTLEDIVTPITSKLYDNATPPPGEGGEGEEEDSYDERDEL